MKRRIEVLLAVGAFLFPLLVTTPALAEVGWIVQCGYSHSLKDDPIVFPRQPGASHLHDFIANRTVNANSTLSSLLAGSTTCPATSGDTAAYWVPALYENGTRILPTGTSSTGRSTRQRFYYVKAGTRPVIPFPPGFAMIIGNSKATSAAQNPWLGSRINWGCADNNNPPGSKVPVQCPGTGIITVHFEFPMCWDGTYTPLVNEVPQMTYASSGVCPSGFKMLPRLIQRFEWPVGTSTGTIALSSGPNYTIHADFVNSWQQTKLAWLVTNCLNANVDCKQL